MKCCYGVFETLKKFQTVTLGNLMLKRNADAIEIYSAYQVKKKKKKKKNYFLRGNNTTDESAKAKTNKGLPAVSFPIEILESFPARTSLWNAELASV